MSRGLTIKQSKFVKAYVETGNGTQAALQAYDTNSPEVAATLATENISKPNIREAIDQILESQGITISSISKNINRLATHEPDKISAETVLRSNVELAKLLNLYPDKKSTHLRVDLKGKFNGMDFSKAKKEYESLHNGTEDFISEAEE